MKLYKKLFENALGQPAVDSAADAQTFEQGFENPQDFQNVEQETQGITLTPEEIDAIVKKGRFYKERIDSFATLLDKVQQDVMAGLFKSVQTKDMEKFMSIKKDLLNLGLALTTGVGDSIIKKNAEKKSPAK